MVDFRGRSAGKGLGQQTGGNTDTDFAEAQKLLEMIYKVGAIALANTVSMKDFEFVESMNDWIFHDKTPAGKQLFRLRDIKDKLIEAGIL